MIRLGILTVLAATPAMAASGPFFSLANTNFIVLIAFLIFVGILLYARVPGRVLGLLDKRAASIRSDLDEARAIRDEAQSLLASYERKAREAHDQVDRIIATAKSEAETAAEQAKADLARSVERRLKAAEEQIEQARDAAVREVRDRAIQVATAAAAAVVAERMTDERSAELIDQSIETVGAKLH